MTPILHDSGETDRLILASLLALALHGALLFAVPTQRWWQRPFEQPSFEVVLLPPQQKPGALANQDAAKLIAPTEGAVERTVTPLASDLPPAPPIPASVPLPSPEFVGPSQPVASVKPPLPAKTRSTSANRLVAKPTPTTEPTDSRKAKAVARSPVKPTPTPKSTGAVSEKRWVVPIKPLAKQSAEARVPVKSQSVERELAESTPAANFTESPRSDREPQSAVATRSTVQKRGRRPLDSSALLGQIASLETQSQRQAYRGVRAKRVSPNDSQSLEGFYISSWVRKVEQIGEMNFPDIARQLNLSTGPTLEVAIRADGSLQDVRVARSSGNAELDRAAQRIVRLGAPYAAFPPQLRQQYDLLYISRPWRFESNGRLRMR